MSIKGVPAGIRRRVCEGFIRAMKTSPTLANGRVIKTWTTWQGDSKEPIGEITPAQMPACMVRLLGGPVSREASRALPGQPRTYINKSEFTIIIDVWTAGTDQSDVSDVADQIYKALSPDDPQERASMDAKLKDAGIKDCQLTREILPTSAESFGLSAIAGQGSYLLTVYTNA